MRPLKYYINDPFEILVAIAFKLKKYLSDKLYLKIIFKHNFGYYPNLRSPKTFNEKLQWLKLYCRRPEYSIMADKYAVKNYVSSIIGDQYIIPTLCVWENVNDIVWEKLPNQFILKTTHDSGGIVVCRDRQIFNIEAAKKKLTSSLKHNYYILGREWPYKNIKPRIILDQYLDDYSGNELRDYKFWCFNGKPIYMYCTIKGENVYENFYDMQFQPVAIDHGFPRHIPEFEPPKNFELMKELAAKLSDGIPFVRVDFYEVDDKVYFGEFTFYDWAGLKPFGGQWDEVLGELIILP